jgi:glycosyltransferase involved in cell wall biosynthesis
MKIIILPSWYPAHGGNFFANQAQELVSKGLDVSVLAPKIVSWREPKKWFKSFVFGENISYEQGVRVLRWSLPRYPFSVHAMPNLTAYAFEKMFLKLWQKQGKPDLLHAHSAMWAGYAAARISEKYNIPYVMTEHRGRFNIVGEDVESWMKPYFSKAFQGARQVLLVGSLLKRGLAPFYSKVEEALVLSNGVQSSLFAMSPPPQDGRFHFLFVGTINKLKGIDLLLEAIEKIRHHVDNVVFHIVGDGPLKNTIEEQVAALGLEDKVKFYGFLPHEKVAQMMMAAHAFVLPTRYDAQGVVFLEAMSCGLPIIASEGAPPEVCPEFAGIRVPVNDSDALAAALLTIMQRYPSMDRRAIRQYAVENFDFEVVSSRLISIYRQIIENNAQQNADINIGRA